MMSTTLLVARLLLALVFAVAGLSKLADRQGFRKAVIDFGLPSSLAAPLAILLTLAELTVAVALIPASTAVWGAMGALALLALFVIGISINLARGRTPDCRCFGQIHSAPVGWGTLVRNGALAFLAGLLVWQGWKGNAGPSMVGWIGALSTFQLFVVFGAVAGLGTIVLTWLFMIEFLRQNGRLLVRLEVLEDGLDKSTETSRNGHPPQRAAGLLVGTNAPDFDLEDLYGETLTLGSLLAPDKPLLLFFTDPNCGPCTRLLPEIERWQEEHADKLTIASLSRGKPEENRSKVAEHGLNKVLLQEDWEVSDAYRVTATPSAVVVLPEGKVGSPVATGPDSIRSLVARMIQKPPRLPMRPTLPEMPCPECGKIHQNSNGANQSAPSIKIGDPAPEIKLPNLNGGTTDLAEFAGSETLVLFWNPGCGFCQKMLPDLQDWEEDQNLTNGGRKLLMVSAGTVEANRAMGLESSVALDKNFVAARKFGAGGTPSAVLVDEEGKIASKLGVGAPAVIEMARTRQAES